MNALQTTEPGSSVDAILYGVGEVRGLPENFVPPINKTTVLRALNDGTYWVNGKGEVVPLSKIDINYAMNIRQLLRRRLQPDEYQNTPLWTALGRIRRRKIS